jgi:hypothetical protein
MNVEWDEFALDDFSRLKYESAERVARAVAKWAETGEGIVVVVSDPSGDDVDTRWAESGIFRLFVGDSHVVLFLINDTTNTMHVIQVRRA